MDMDFSQVWDMLIKQGPLATYMAYQIWKKDRQYAALVDRVLKSSDARAAATASAMDSTTEAFTIVKEKLDAPGSH